MWLVLEIERERFPWPPEELVLGAVLAQYQEVFAHTAGEGANDVPGRDELVRLGVSAALEEHVGELRRAAEAAGELTELVDEKFGAQKEFEAKTRQRSADRPTKKTARRSPRKRTKG